MDYHPAGIVLKRIYHWVFVLSFLIYITQSNQFLFAQIGFPYCETFDGGGVQQTTVFGGSARLVDGVLRLTDAEMEQNGYVYIDIPFSSAYGIKASFEYFSYGGTGADGLVAFLFDAAVSNFQPGGFGGSLGYAQRGNQSGLTGAYLGIGFDVFGNFGTTNENKQGSFPGAGVNLVPDAVVIRGPGSGTNGYAFVAGRRTMQAGNDGLPESEQFSISSGGVGTGRIADPNIEGYRKVFLDLIPNPEGDGYLVVVEMMVTTEPNTPRMVKILERPYNFSAPQDLKIGFSASTGGQYNIHEIGNLIVEVSNEDGLENPEGTDIDDVASCEGQENTYDLFNENITLPNDNSILRCIQFYASLKDIQAEEEDICSQARCRPENRVLVLPQGTFRADDQGGGFTFFPNLGFTDEEVIVYYTITDNYGKTSTGNSIKLLIQESPEPVNILAEGLEEVAESIRLCEGDGILLKAIGDEAYFSFEWYKDETLLPDSDQSEWFANQPGVYKVIAYNAKSCPTISEGFEVINPDFPLLELNAPVIGCEVGMALDLREFILDYDEALFDYRLETPFGELLSNEELANVFLSGAYQLQVKHKDLDCWSPQKEVDIQINTVWLLPNFDYEVDGAGIKTEEEGGIFIDDPIRFTDLSQGDAVAWEWDFGDGTSSTERNPVHVFGQKGIFRVELTVINALGCKESISIEVPLTLSYRIMFPTGFTPDLADNNHFRPKTKGIVNMEIQVFNLWGNMVFRSTNLDTVGWDGKINGEAAPAGNYVYRVKMVSIDGEVIDESGRFTLIR
ncbi:PKD domain-containing protein [Cecembia lonarensis]|uniref:PKD domain protein n=1 Tax=Cecembia lonarensis (strain CCUG 58316 / KCTC 22772 / LW9) TaxID=1225176 RepID=K1L7A3_CECL9|nr:PKD domain-containing protein [Cecembia lonarensis]EKB48012.1 PKD domain protein [Cecembia lonarensis LW9]